MNYLFISLILMLLGEGPNLFAQEKELYEIKVVMQDVSSDNGMLFISLYDSESDFLSKGFKRNAVPIKEGVAEVVFKDIPEGVYAIACFHDENNNNKLDTNFLGIPKEGTGTSNNATSYFGPPKFEDAKFKLTKNIQLIINL